jgi:hypothetical protein
MQRWQKWMQTGVVQLTSRDSVRLAQHVPAQLGNFCPFAKPLTMAWTIGCMDWAGKWYFGDGTSKWKQLVEQYSPWQLALAPSEKSLEQIAKEQSLLAKKQKEQELENIRRVALLYIRAQIVDIYKKHDRSKLGVVDALLEEWKGQEDVLLWNVQHKYLVEGAKQSRGLGRCWPG